MKKLKWVVLAVVLLVVVGVSLVLMNINGIVRSGAEKASTSSLGLDTKVGGASVSIFGGSIGLSDFEVASPAGFDAPKMMTLGGISLKVGASELRQDPIRVSSVGVSKPRLVLEQKGGKLNLQAFQQSLPKSDPNAEPPKLVIGEVQVDDAEVLFRPGLPGLAQEIVVKLPDVTVKEIGTGVGNQNGVAIKEAMLAVAQAMAQEAMKSDQIPPELRAILQADIGALRAKVEQEVRAEVDKQVGAATQRLQQEGNKVREEAEKKLNKGLGDLLKKP